MQNWSHELFMSTRNVITPNPIPPNLITSNLDYINPEFPGDSEFPAVIPSLFGDTKSGPIAFSSKTEFDRRKSTAKTKRVLVVDDEEVIADSVTEILNNGGYEAHGFYSGEEAIEFAGKHCPDLVLSDVIMPKLNGIDTVLAIKKLCPNARIILFSGQAATSDLLESARALGHTFEMLPKPIHPEQLLKKLATKERS